MSLRFRRLEVSHFRAIDRAELEFAAGLNVLYGPNDLGKTTLASAMRAALLLPADSSAHQAFLPWHSKEQPRVLLAFELEGKLWRIQKAFGVGSAAQALLESSLDGQRYREEARGRAVDSRVRELLRWGVEAPGGRSGARGLPESFLSHVLLATQGSVGEILERTLAADRDGSGRERLHDALQALAQDPVFQRVLRAAEEKVESAFTATGRRKLGQSSPFASLRQSIAELVGDLERVAHQRRESDEVQRRIVLANQERLDAEARVEALRDRASREASVLAELAAQRAVRERAALAQQALGARRAAERDLRQLATELELAREANARQARQLAQSAAARASAEADAARTEAALRELGSEASRAVHAQRLSVLERERQQLELRILALQRAGQKEQARAHAEAALAAESRALGQAEQEERELGQRAAVQERALQHTRELQAVARWREALQAEQRARQAAEAGAELRRSAAAARERAAALAAEAGTLEALTPERLGELRSLDRRLRVARARIEVGLSVTLSLPPGRGVAVAVDGGPAQQHAGERSVSARGRTQVRVQLDDQVQLLASAGEQEWHAEAELLAAEWAACAQPLLVTAGVADVEALAQRAEQLETGRREAQAALREAASLDARATEKLEQAAELEPLGERAATLRAELGAADVDVLARELEPLGAAWERALGRRVADAESEGKRLQHARLGRATLLERLAARAAGAALARDAACAERDQALAELAALGAAAAEPLEFGWLAREVAALQPAFAAASQACAQAESGFRTQLAAAERARDAALRALTGARQAHEAALASSHELREHELGLSSQLRERELHFEPSLLPAAEAELARARAELSNLPQLPAVSPETLAATEQELERESARLNQLLAELRRAEGALGQVGGDVVVQREAQTREALERARELERELEQDYDAYQLLARTLREVENEEGAHLGRALSEPVSERFQRLTAGRYGRVGLDAALGFEGISIAGQARAYRELSEGTQEQLATIFRLCVAEQLGTSLVLDDHLAQTHRERVAWFRCMLREAAERIQILVLTARPEDYVSAEEVLAATGAALRVIDLEQVIVRARYTAA